MNARERAVAISLAIALAEKVRRTKDEHATKARDNFYYFLRYAWFRRTGHHWVHNWHHIRIAQVLEKVFRGELKNVIFNLPPRYSKTEMVVVHWIAWCMGKVADAEFIHTSYASPLAYKNSAEIQALIKSEVYQEVFPGTTIDPENEARHKWKTAQGGSMYASGMKGSITGWGAGKMRPGFGGALVIDDPHKASEARQDVIRQSVLTWFQETLQSRRNSPDTPTVLVMQRLHEKDLAGFLEAGGNGEKWTVVKFEAIYEDEQGVTRALWPYKHTLEQLKVMQDAMPYMFAGQYQQRPSAAEGNIFKPDRLNYIAALPLDKTIMWVRGWDFGASVPKDATADPDWTAGVRIGRYADGRFVIAHALRMRGLPDEVEKALVDQSRRDGVRVKVDIPQDPGQAGKSQVLYFTKKLQGLRVVSSPESGDKVTRAEPLAAQINVGNCDIVEGEWNDAFTDEMRMFPNGSHDDQVDASSRAFNRLTEAPSRLKITPETLRRIRSG